MHVVLSIWLVPLSLTVLIWAAAIFWPTSRANSGEGRMSAAISGLLRFAAASACTLLVWLAFFIWLFVAGA